MIRTLTSALGTRNLLVLGLVGSLALGGATVVFADDRDDAINRREDLIQADVEARDDDGLDDATGDGNGTVTAASTDRASAGNDASRTGRDRDTGGTRDRDTGARSGTGDTAAAPAAQDTGDTRSNDGTVGGDTTAAQRPPAGGATNAGDSGDGSSGDGSSRDRSGGGGASGGSDD
jgi:hypothetical protein